MNIESRLAKLEQDEAAAGDTGPLVVRYGCTPDTDPKPAVPRKGDTRLCLAPGQGLPEWAKGRPTIFLPAETGPHDWPGD
ncbi:hypothetical protein [Limnoglobus roseus]|uniref:Uncharacterized protein n=1 Tax=Limnoglobus roseus TaxID=2598579 RepID=A0A5C1ALN8_9BACT|nr:hypothetical protein [Limnoglobus roseus]QEL18652.1 hypothetical protein PX52LOC_05685 [Limnoglobus roseus]